MSNVRRQRILAGFFLLLVLSGSAAGALRAFRSAAPAQPVAATQHPKPQHVRR